MKKTERERRVVEKRWRRWKKVKWINGKG